MDMPGRDELNRVVAYARANPEAAAELRRVILTDDLLDLPARFGTFELSLGALQDAVRELTASHRELTASHRELTASHHELTASHRELAASHRELAASHHELRDTVRELAASHHELAASHHELRDTVRELAEAQRRTEETLREFARATNRRLGNLERVTGMAYQHRVFDRVDGLLALGGLQAEEIHLGAVTRWAQRQGMKGDELRSLRLADWLGIGNGPTGSALIVAEASITADAHDVERLNAIRAATHRHGIPTMPVLIAYQRATDLPAAEALIQQGISFAIDDAGEAHVADSALGELGLTVS